MTKENVDVYRDDTAVATMVERYKAVCGDKFTYEDRCKVVEELAAEFGKGEPSIRAKLVREGVYLAKTPVTKTGAPVISKRQMVDDLIGSLRVNLTESEAESLEKATKSTIRKIQAAVDALYSELDMDDVVVDEEDEVQIAA